MESAAVLDYSRRQIGRMTLAGLGAVALIVVLVAAIDGRMWILAFALLPVLLGLGFGWLTVSVTETTIDLRFGVGWIRRSIPIDRVASLEVVRNRWWYGWGLRLTPHGPLWNVEGLDAVELRYRAGGRFRIGTDDPNGLRAAIEKEISA